MTFGQDETTPPGFKAGRQEGPTKTRNHHYRRIKTKTNDHIHQDQRSPRAHRVIFLFSKLRLRCGRQRQRRHRDANYMKSIPILSHRADPSRRPTVSLPLWLMCVDLNEFRSTKPLSVFWDQTTFAHPPKTNPTDEYRCQTHRRPNPPKTKPTAPAGLVARCSEAKP